VGPLAVEHGFAVFLTNPEKAEFAVLDAGNTIGELRSFTWSADGKQLAIVGNSMGSGNIYITDPKGSQLLPVLPNGELGYLMDAAWSRDGKQIVLWSNQNNKVLYLMNADGTGLVEKKLTAQILGAPQFWPDGSSVVFYGADTNSTGLFEMMLVDSGVALINPSVEYASSYAFSPDGAHLAYMEYDHDLGEARLVSEELTAREIKILGTLPIPKGSGSSVPETANLSWSADSQSLVFDFGRNAVDRAIYLGRADGTELVKVADAAYAPAISADGKCLAYIRDNQVFLMDLTRVSVNSTTATPILLADLPSGRGTPNFKQDKLQWRPGGLP
jgi:Tol biopolymer transport system component